MMSVSICNLGFIENRCVFLRISLHMPSDLRCERPFWFWTRVPRTRKVQPDQDEEGVLLRHLGLCLSAAVSTELQKTFQQPGVCKALTEKFRKLKMLIMISLISLMFSLLFYISVSPVSRLPE